MNKKAFVVWLKLCFLLIITICSWFTLHEYSHALVCKIIGGNPSLESILPHPSINCAGIVVDKEVVVSHPQYFFYAMIPYVIALSILILISLNKKITVFLAFSITFVFLLDAGYNYLASPILRTDFTNMAIVNEWFFWLAVFIVISEFFVGIGIIKERWRDFKVSVKKLIN